MNSARLNRNGRAKCQKSPNVKIFLDLNTKQYWIDEVTLSGCLHSATGVFKQEKYNQYTSLTLKPKSFDDR